MPESTATELDALPTIGFVGLGHMGAPMALRLAARGAQVRIFDALPHSVAAVADVSSAVPVQSLHALAEGSDIVITMLPSGPVVAEVVLGAAGVLSGLKPGAVVVDMSSSAPHETLRLGDTLKQSGVALVDAPVSGGVERARSGDLAIIAGGEPAAFERCRGILELMAREVFHVGGLGSGHALKALNNALSAAGLAAAAEVLLIGHRFGLDPQIMVDVFNVSSGRNNATENKLSQFVLSGTYASGFSLHLLAKDLEIARDLAERMELAHEFVTTAHDLVREADRKLGADADHTELAAYLQQRSGVSIQRAA